MARFINAAKTVALCLVVIFALIIIFTSLTLLHGRISPNLTHDNMVRSLQIMDKEGVYPNVGTVIGHVSFTGFGGGGSTIDNYSNMWMIQGADSEHFFDSSEYQKGEPYNHSEREEIVANINAQAFASAWKNGNWWSGYRVFMKPLLIIMDVRGIRTLQLLLVIASIVWASVRVFRDIGAAESIFMICAIFRAFGGFCGRESN